MRPKNFYQKQPSQTLFEANELHPVPGQPFLTYCERMRELDIRYNKEREEIPETENWEQEVSELQTYFNNTPLPTISINISPGNRIFDVQRFVDCHFETIKARNGNLTYLPYLERLRELKQYLIKNKS